MEKAKERREGTAGAIGWFKLKLNYLSQTMLFRLICFASFALCAALLISPPHDDIATDLVLAVDASVCLFGFVDTFLNPID